MPFLVNKASDGRLNTIILFFAVFSGLAVILLSIPPPPPPDLNFRIQPRMVANERE